MKKLKWQEKLTVNEILHLRSIAGIKSKAQAIKTFEVQARIRRECEAKGLTPELGEPCFECKQIAIKLGFPV